MLAPRPYAAQGDYFGHIGFKIVVHGWSIAKFFRMGFGESDGFGVDHGFLPGPEAGDEIGEIDECFGFGAVDHGADFDL